MSPTASIMPRTPPSPPRFAEALPVSGSVSPSPRRRRARSSSRPVCSARAWLESLVLAILLGTLVRSLWTPSRIWRRGIDFPAKYLLEFAVVLLGASVSAAMIAEAGAAFLFGIGGVVIMAIATSYGIGRLVGLPRRMAS